MTTQDTVDAALLNRARFAVKLSAAQGKVHNVPKDKRNEGQKFNYTSTESIFAMMRPILADAGLAVLMTTRSMELMDATTAHVSLDVSLIDTDTGYSETMTFDGFGKDGGDKAVPKAYTMAAKYWARIAFMIDLQADAEADDAPARRTAAPRLQAAPLARSQPAPVTQPTNGHAPAAAQDTIVAPAKPAKPANPAEVETRWTHQNQEAEALGIAGWTVVMPKGQGRNLAWWQEEIEIRAAKLTTEYERQRAGDKQPA